MLDFNDFIDILACPFCHGRLILTDSHSLQCSDCGEKYSRSDAGQINLKLKTPKQANVSVLIKEPEDVNNFEFLPMVLNPVVTFDFLDLEIPLHLSKEIVSYFPAPKSRNARVLDLGCGNGIHKEILEKIGYEWIGLDYFAKEAPILGDAQALPFQDESFDFVLAVSMIHEIPYPQIAMIEVFRVLKPSGTLVGTAPFLEPYYNTTSSHFSHAGIHYLTDACGFEIEVISPSSSWSALDALAEMALFPGLPNVISKALTLPLKYLHIFWWKLAYLFTRREAAKELERVKRISASTDFVVKKPMEKNH